jgi:hypothetical protein
MNIRNEDILGLVVEVPEGHRHIRTTLTLRDGTELTLQEAAVSNLLRAFVTVKTHPVRSRVVMKAVRADDRKEGFAKWQLLEVEDEDV